MRSKNKALGFFGAGAVVVASTVTAIGAEAATHLDDALRLGGGDAWLLYQVGSVDAAVGDIANARAHLTTALDLNPEFDLVHAPLARELLADLPDTDPPADG